MPEGGGAVSFPLPFLWLQWGDDKWTQVRFHEEEGKHEWILGKDDYLLQRDEVISKALSLLTGGP